jgi:hypothetical protein
MKRTNAMTEVVARRLSAQLLAGTRAPSTAAVAERLLAVQGQDARGVRLAIRARAKKGMRASDVDRALTDERSVLITWLNRGTLHLVRREDYPWLHALTAPPHLRGTLRRLDQEGVGPAAADRGVEAIETALVEDGPLTREQLSVRVERAGVRVAGQALIHILALASLRGLTVRGPVVDGRHGYALVRDWIGEPEKVERNQALTELARRYLAGHGPASDRDLARWAGLPLRDARAGLRAIASELKVRPDGLFELSSSRRTPKLPPPRLLGAYDPILLGWTSRAPLLGDHQEIVTVNGLFRPFALAGGAAVARWAMPKGEVVLEPFGRLAPAVRAALNKDAADVARFLAR